jgi:hypothetical protein
MHNIAKSLGNKLKALDITVAQLYVMGKEQQSSHL